MIDCWDEMELKDSYESARTDTDETLSLVGMLVFISDHDLDTILLGYPKCSGHTER